NPVNRVALALADGAVLFVDANGPRPFEAAELFEAQRRMRGVFQKKRVGPARCGAGRGRELVVGTPEARPRPRVHSRCKSSGSSRPSAADCRKNASSFGKGRASLSRSSQAASSGFSGRAKRK